MKGRERSVLTGRRLFLPLAAAALTVSGCIRESVSGSEATYRMELWVPLVIALGGMAALPAGWVIRTKSARIGWALLILGPVAIFGFAPSAYMDKAVVSDKTFDVRTGIYGGTAHTVNLDEVQAVRMTSEVSRTRRGRTVNHFLNFDSKTGSSQKVPVSHQVVQAALPRLIDELESRGIPLINQTNE